MNQDDGKHDLARENSLSRRERRFAPSANQACWPAQKEMERLLTTAIESFGYKVIRGHHERPESGHGFIASQREGIEVFRRIPAESTADCRRSRMAILPSRAGGTHDTPRTDSHGCQLVGPMARLGRHAQPQRLADESRHRLLHAVERKVRRLVFFEPTQRLAPYRALRPRYIACSSARRYRALQHGGRIGTKTGERVAARQSHHGCLRRRLHGNV